MKNTIGTKLMELRKSKGKSRADVAKAVGISPSSVAMHELDLRIPSDKVKIKYSKFYGKSVASIFFAQ